MEQNMNNDSFPGEADSDELCAHHDTRPDALGSHRPAAARPRDPIPRLG